MTDKEMMEKWEKVDDPQEALRIICENEHLFGYDSYYAELRRAMLNIGGEVQR
jgi:hypothetical protein